MGKRNPIARMLRENPVYRSQVAKSTDERTKQADQWDRSAKHKSRHHSVEDLQIGDEVRHDGEEAMVKQPAGPEGMVGITVDGEYNLVPGDAIEVMEENIALMRLLCK